MLIYFLQFFLILFICELLLLFQLKVNPALFYDIYYNIFKFYIKHRKNKNKNNDIWLIKLKKQFLNNLSLEDQEDLIVFLIKDYEEKINSKKIKERKSKK